MAENKQLWCMSKINNKLKYFIVVFISLFSALFFFHSISKLWPIADFEIHSSEKPLVEKSTNYLKSFNYNVEDYDVCVFLTLDEEALTYVETEFSSTFAQNLIRNGEKIYCFNIIYKKRGVPDAFYVAIHPVSGILGWFKEIKTDESGDKIDIKTARSISENFFIMTESIERGEWKEIGVNTIDLPDRRDYEFYYERIISKIPELRERLEIKIAGINVVKMKRKLLVPSNFNEEIIRKKAPEEILRLIGFILMIIGSISAFIIFIINLNRGEVNLGKIILPVVAVSVCWLLTNLFQTSYLFTNWNSLWPKWLSYSRTLVYLITADLQVLILFLALVASGDSLNKKMLTEKGKSLWLLFKGKLIKREVVLSTFRGFLIGLVSGALISMIVFLISFDKNSLTAIQPRGFYFYILNSSFPQFTSFLYFLLIALIEEFGYRYFGIMWFLKLTKKSFIAVLITSIIYGLTHATLSFLPPAQPFWGRAVLMTAIGILWGISFLKFDLLTVVTAHITADLFIFNFPGLSSGNISTVISSYSVLLIPTLPVLVFTVLNLRKTIRH